MYSLLVQGVFKGSMEKLIAFCSKSILKLPLLLKY